MIKNRTWKKIITTTLALVCCFSFTACNKDSSAKTAGYPGTPEKDMVTIDIMGEPTTLNYFHLQDSTAGDVLRLCMSGLIRLDGNDLPQADLAKSWHVSEDGKTYTFALDPEAKWSDGEPVTAHDYYYSWVTQMKATTASPFAYLLYENIKNGTGFYEGTKTEADLGIKILDPFTLEVTWEAPIPFGLHLLSSTTYLPMQQKAYEAIGDADYALSPEKLITNGPYTMTHWTHEDSITFAKNETYANEKNIRIPRVKLIMLGDENARLNAFQGGQVDVCNLSGDQITLLESKSPETIQRYIDNGTWFISFNTKNEFLSNINLRKALSLSIDLDSFLGNVVKDGSVVAHGFVPDSILGAEGKPFAEARGDLISYDVNAAKAHFALALQELGLTADQITLELLSSDTSYGQTQSTYLQQQWKDAFGINVSIRPLPWKARVQAERAGDFDLLSSGWGADYNDPLTYLSMLQSNNPNNTGGYSNPAYDALIAQAILESDPVVRQGLFVDAEKLLIQDAVIAPMYFSTTAYATSAKLSGLTRTGFQTFDVTDGATIQ